VNEIFHLAFRASIVKRSLKIAIVVGVILITINHGDAILSGAVTRRRIFQMALTVVVPYVVSTLSSVQAMREMARKSAPTAKAKRETGITVA
jgi:hypothetical protein